MGYDKAIDSAALEANLTTVADAIRAKGGTTDKLAFPAEYVTAIENIPTGTTVYAVIGVTYPGGSTCTATDGTTTLSAPDTSGTWACVVPNAGTWTVTATNGTDTATETVTISAEGQVETVQVDYETPITLTVSHTINASGISILIVKTADSSTITFGTLSGTASYATMTDKNYDFTFKNRSYTLVCTVRQYTQPFFVGSILCGGETISSFTGGTSTGANSSYPWEFSQEGEI